MGEMLRQLSQDACCTVYFRNTSHIISLPDATQADCHAYLKEELAKRGITDLRNKDIQVSRWRLPYKLLFQSQLRFRRWTQVEADGSFGLLLPDAKLRATSYRVTLKPGLEDASGTACALLTCCLDPTQNAVAQGARLIDSGGLHFIYDASLALVTLTW